MSTNQIKAVNAREILDNRLEPTLRVTVKTEQKVGVADVPAGRSRGKNEVIDLRDSDNRYDGLGVRSAISNINEEIAPVLVGHDVRQQRKIDQLLVNLDGTATKEKIGGNAITGVSLAVLKAGAQVSDLPLYRYLGGSDAHVLPIPFFDLIEGGELAGGDLEFQEHQIVPVGVQSFPEAIRKSAEVYYRLGEILKEQYGDASLNVGYEGGYTPVGMTDPRDAFDLELQAIEQCGYEDEFGLAADVAASHFYDPESETYSLIGEDMNREKLLTFYEDLIDDYPIVSLEDPLEEEDFKGWSELTERVNIQIIGDDLFVTNQERLQKGISQKAANSLLVKVNQVGTVTETMEAVRLAKQNGYTLQVSERSGQTSDTWLADFAVGLNAGQIKTGVTRSERTEQYNRLLKIDEEMDSSNQYGNDTLKQHK